MGGIRTHGVNAKVQVNWRKKLDKKRLSRILLGGLPQARQLGNAVPLPSDAEAFGCSLAGLTRAHSP